VAGLKACNLLQRLVSYCYSLPDWLTVQQNVTLWLRRERNLSFNSSSSSCSFLSSPSSVSVSILNAQCSVLSAVRNTLSVTASICHWVVLSVSSALQLLELCLVAHSKLQLLPRRSTRTVHRAPCGSSMHFADYLFCILYTLYSIKLEQYSCQKRAD